jgi:hypothetical protein
MSDLLIPSQNDDLTQTSLKSAQESKKSDLKNIKYKMMVTGMVTNSATANLDSTSDSKTAMEVSQFLEKESRVNKAEPWCKLNKTLKLKKMVEFSLKYKETYDLSEEEHCKLNTFLKDCLNRKKLLKVKEVVYDKVNGVILEIPVLVKNETKNRFTLKRPVSKKVSTTKLALKYDSDDDGVELS